MTILENLPIRPDALGKLMIENLMLHQRVKDALQNAERKPA